MFKIFIAESILKQVIHHEEGQSDTTSAYLYRVMRELKRLYVASDAPDKEWAEQLKQQHGIMADYSKSTYIKNIPAHPDTVLQHPSALFILDLPSVEIQKIQKSYGVICMNAGQLNIRQLIDINDTHIVGEGEVFFKGWETVVKSVKSLPSNALLLTDRYLFSFNHPKAGDGIANVRDILNALLPQQFLGEYHVIVIFDNESKHSSYQFNDLATRLNKVKQALGRTFPITLEVQRYTLFSK